LAKLSAEDMKAVKNMKLLAGSSNNQEKSSGSFLLTFDGQRVTSYGFQFLTSKFWFLCK